MRKSDALFRIKQQVALAKSFPYRHCCIDFPQRISSEYNFIMSSTIHCIEYKNGCYIGGVENNVEQGYGIYIDDKGYLYLGQWFNGKESGEGIWIQSEYVYIGNFSGGERDGQGLEYSRNIGLELDAVYSNGKITKVLWASKSFKADNGVSYDKDTNTFEGGNNGCLWIVLIVILISAIVEFFKWLF